MESEKYVKKCEKLTDELVAHIIKAEYPIGVGIFVINDLSGKIMQIILDGVEDGKQ